MNNFIRKMKEIWKPIVGYEGLYEVSNHGRVKSLKRTKEQNQNKPGTIILLEERFLKMGIRNGYHYVNLSKYSKCRKFSVHRLVAMAFIKNEFNKKEVNHKDGKKLNNYFENLEWCTRQENAQHSWDNGLQFFNEEQRLDISRRHKGKVHQSVNIKDVITGVIYKSIQDLSNEINITSGELYRFFSGIKTKNSHKLSNFKRCEKK